MVTPKTYLNVPYAQKDAAKALGARWDATHKKWYVPAGKDLALFAQWQTVTEVPAATLATSTSQSTAKTIPANALGVRQAATGVFTRPSIADFVPYSGDAPPWD
jgi:hypothetical protein